MSDDIRATVFCRAPWLGDADWLDAEWEESEYLPGDEDDSSDVVEA